MGTIDWIWWALGGIVAMLGLVVIGRSLFFDADRGRRRCRKCWYDMSGLATGDAGGLKCPECGWTAKRETDLFKPRRRYRPAALGLLTLLLGVGGFLAPKIRRDGWLSVVPTTVLLILVPPPSEDTGQARLPHRVTVRMTHQISRWTDHPVSKELIRRDAANRMWAWQWRLYGALKMRCATRPVWVQGEPIRGRLIMPCWVGEPITTGSWLVSQGKQVSSTPSPPPPPPEEVGNWIGHTAFGFSYEISDRDTDTVMVEATVWPNWRRSASNSTPLSSGQILMRQAVPIRIATSIDEVIKSAKSSALDTLLAEWLSFSVKLAVNNEERMTYDLIIEPTAASADTPSEFDNIALGLRIDLLDKDDVIDSWSTTLSTDDYGPKSFRSTDALLRTAGIRPTPSLFKNFTIRVRGDAKASLADLTRSEYWAGELTFPLADFLEQIDGKVQVWRISPDGLHGESLQDE